MARLPAHIRERLDLLPPEMLIDTKWYLATDAHALIDVTFADNEERRMAIEVGAKEAARYTLSVVNRALLRLFGTPTLYAKLGQRMWEKYYNHGVIEHTMENQNTLTTRIHGWHAHHPFICEGSVPTAAYIFEAMGLTNVRAERTACVSRGGSECVYVMRWKS